MSKFSEWLKLNRRKSGLTLVQLKSAIGDLCTDAYLSRLENDKHGNKKPHSTRPDREIVIALAEVFKEDKEYALWLADYAPEVYVSPKLPKFLYKYNFNIFTPEDLREIENFIRFKSAAYEMSNAHIIGRAAAPTTRDELADYFEPTVEAAEKKIEEHEREHDPPQKAA